MPSIKLNVIANLLGNAATGLIGFVFIPFYVEFMGVESYGLVGFYVTLQMSLLLADFGLAMAVNRYAALYSADVDRIQEIGNLVRTAEILYWSIALCILLAIVLLSQTLADRWIKVEALDRETVRLAILLMGLCAATQWPIALYKGGLEGLQRQVTYNATNGALSIIRAVGALYILWAVSSSVLAFFIWQFIFGIFNTVVIARLLWASMPVASIHPKFSFRVLGELRAYAIGTFILSSMSVMATLVDKVALSNLLTLTDFGYYTLAFVAANFLGTVAQAVTGALFPRLTVMAGEPDERRITVFYHRSCQWMAAIALPLGITAAVFSREVMLLWTGNPAIAENTSGVASVLFATMSIGALVQLPHSLQLAHGWTRLAMWNGAARIAILVPIGLFLMSTYGAAGAAVYWLLITISYALVIVPIMHRRLLKHELGSWWFKDVLWPATTILVVVIACRYLLPLESDRLELFLTLSLVVGLAFSIAVLTLGHVRSWTMAAVLRVERLRS